ncbi:MAG: putative baseplate assembly protein [Amycolatopsis sp.]|nr:putative baseplate assembly protein [Amycolatopsis sp.]
MSCGCAKCCEGVTAVTPIPSYNRPGLPALSYRAGTHGSFRESMLARLSSRPALTKLTSREPDDASIALLDCWAVVGDVLTFYQERIANEGYLRTATEPESLNLLGRLVGYTPRPPLGSSTYLAYTLGPAAKSVIPAGAGVRSVAAQGGLPQTFETTEELVAREEWNTLQVRLNEPPDITAATAKTLDALTVEGSTANLKGGDRLLFVFGRFDSTPDSGVRVVKESKPDFLANRTAVTLVSADPQDPFVVAANYLEFRVKEAEGAPIVSQSAFASQVDSDYLAELVVLLVRTSAPLDLLMGDGANGHHGVPYFLARLREEEAIADARENCAVRDWFTYYIADVLDAGDAVVALAVTLTRLTPSEMDALVKLGRDLVCPCSQQELTAQAAQAAPRGGGGCGCSNDDCDRAAALVALTPVLPSLRKDPSRPPRRSRDLTVAVGDQFRADSDVHAKLLIAADARLAPNLHRAWAAQQIAPPPEVSDLQVMRVKATLLAFKTDSDPVTVGMLVLDMVYAGIVAGSWIVLEPNDGGASVQAVVRSVRQEPRPVTPTPPGTTPPPPPPVTMLVVDFTTLDTTNKTYVVWAQGESLKPLGAAITTPLAGHQIELARMYDGLEPGRWLVVSGERTDVPYTSGVPGTELAMVAGIRQRVDPSRPGDAPVTTLFLANDLAYTYKPGTAKLYGNVVGATQGETRNEILGGGDAGRTGQTFPLRQVLATSPLNWQASDNPLGAEDSLVTRVNGVRWHETDGLVWPAPDEHSYVLASAADGSSSVQFGDGVHGARLPSGIENVTATYRIGAGSSGNVPAGTITQLAAQPLGVTAVTNPIAATGGADGDGPDDIRSTVPLRMLALDRLVSVRDHEDFTRARAGIGKASARKLRAGGQEFVHVTIAGIGDVPIDPFSGLFSSLEVSLVEFGDLGVPVRVSLREHVLVVVRAGVKVLPDYSWDLVQPAVRDAVRTELGFTARGLGEAAYLSRVVSVMQAVEGVDYVDVDLFHGIQGDVSPIDLATIVEKLTVVDTAVPALPARFQEVTLGPDDLRAFSSLTDVANRYGLTIAQLVALNPGLTGPLLSSMDGLTVFRGVRPAQLAVLPADVPEALTLRRIP